MFKKQIVSLSQNTLLSPSFGGHTDFLLNQSHVTDRECAIGTLFLLRISIITYI